MQSSVDNQLKVLRLAELDLQTAALNQKTRTLPEAIAHHEFTLEFEKYRDLRIAAETELSDLSGEINRAEVTLSKSQNELKKMKLV